MSANPVLWDLDARGVATVTLNRPEVNNAYDAGLIQGLLSAMDELGRQPSLRVVVLKGNGRHFQAGADLKWINTVRPQSPADGAPIFGRAQNGCSDEPGSARNETNDPSHRRKFRRRNSDATGLSPGT